jgi:hypothetical protein
MTTQHTFADGKYTVINDNGNLTALRHGEPWTRDFTGDNLIYWMLVEVERLKAYTTPPQRKPLTDEEIEKLIFKSGGHKSTQNLMSNPMQVREHIELWNERIYAFARAIEAAHGIKDNT